MFSNLIQHGAFARTLFIVAAAKAADDNSPRPPKLRAAGSRQHRATRRQMARRSRRANRGR